ncbi:hypothetical protein TNIN_165791 [Trichonephila inaurata madagascariensis]|uniref:Uncharacterized protein n=1 Tax=Trichonephila inaurata madagascariensis TaxID=2747483 RepID=A0A8X6XZJ9_9ARAC|nr:hypothetical protein TNIN_165791 [Trichonephila inaurata madagascariensis]
MHPKSIIGKGRENKKRRSDVNLKARWTGRMGSDKSNKFPFLEKFAIGGHFQGILRTLENRNEVVLLPRTINRRYYVTVVKIQRVILEPKRIKVYTAVFLKLWDA